MNLQSPLKTTLITTVLFLCLAAPGARAAATLTVPAPAIGRVASVHVRIAPERAGWTYHVGEEARFRIDVTADNERLTGVDVRYNVGPEMFPAPEKHASLSPDGLVIDGGTLAHPGFIRCIAQVEFGGKIYRGVGTAGFDPDKIKPTQTDPADFDAFWNEQKAELAKLPIDARLTLLPDLCTSKVDVYHVSLQNVGGYKTSRFYGILCEPKGPGPYPAVLGVPGAGIRPYYGLIELAEKGVITLQIGIHGIPVNLPKELYDSLLDGALARYPLLNLDNPKTYYYRRVYLGCVRANDFLVSRPKYDGHHLAVIGSSQGGQLSIVTAALDPRVIALAVGCPAFCDVTGYLHGRAGGWPHMFRPHADGTPNENDTPAKIATTAYYDTGNFAARLKVPGFYTWGYNDETCPPTSTFAAYNRITAPKELWLDLELPHAISSEQSAAQERWLLRMLQVKDDSQP